MQIAIAGFGLEGRANLKYFRAKFPDADFTIFDENENLAKNNTSSFSGLNGESTENPQLDSRNESEDDKVKFILGADAFSKISGFDLVLRSPSIPPNKIDKDLNFCHPYTTEGSNKDDDWRVFPDEIRRKSIWSATNEFFAECARKNVPIIGVTGSKGKGTTASFIAEILKQFYEKEGQESPRACHSERSEESYSNSGRSLGLARDDKCVHLVGNIGQPALEILPQIAPNDFVVYELSSFQLWDIEFSPKIAVMTLIEPDHLDVHENMADYVAAKLRIFEFQKAGDAAIYNADDALVREIAEAATNETGAMRRSFPDEKYAHIADCHSGESVSTNSSHSVRSERFARTCSEDPANSPDTTNWIPGQAQNDSRFFYYGDSKLFPVSAVKLPGGHNLWNALAAIDAMWNLLIPEVGAPCGVEPEKMGKAFTKKFIDAKIRIIEKGLSNFHGLPHRLQFIREIGDVKFYDDSIATTPGSVIAALKSFDEPKILIVGGREKGADYTEMAREIDKRNVRKVFAIGENREKIAAVIRENSDVVLHELDYKKMDEIVKEVWQNTAPGDVVILSPAAASFDMFESYIERGEQFAVAVKALE